MIDPRFYSVSGPLRLVDLIDGLAIDLPDEIFQDEMIASPAALLGSQPGQISFLESKKNIAQLGDAKATACLVPEVLAAAVGEKHILPLISKHPRAHFSRLIDRLVTPKSSVHDNGVPTIHADSLVHETARIGGSAVIAAGAQIGPYAVIGPGVHIGEYSKVDAHAVVEFTVTGSHCHIKSGAIIGGRGFGVDGDEAGLVDIAHIGRVVIGDRVSIGSVTCVDRAQLGETALGNDVKIDNQVQIAHNVVIGAGTMIAAQTGISGSCTIGKDVMMGGNVGLADHLSIGDGAQITARAGVMHNIPAGERWGGVPAMPMRDYLKTVAAMRRAIKPKPAKKPLAE